MDVAMIYRGDAPHPAHQGFAEAINADLIALDRHSLNHSILSGSIPEEILNGFLLPNYDVYIAEGTRALYGSLTNQAFNSSILIYLVGDQSLYKLLDRSYRHESNVNYFISKYGMGLLSSLFNRYIDAYISVSKLSEKYAKNIMGSKPHQITNPYIQPDLFDQLGNVAPNLDAKTAITVGNHAKYKGQDLLVKAWPDVREEHPTAKLHLVGKGYPSSYNDIPGVEVQGYVEDLPNALASASVYIQPSRTDSFSVSVLEALRAGLPAIVTETTGSKRVVQKIDDGLIIKPDSNHIASAVSKYFKYDRHQKNNLSYQSRSEGSKFDSRSKKSEFATAFNDIIKEINKNNK